MASGSTGKVGVAEGWAEPGRSVPVVERSDVVVCGGGPAGVAAAIAAARQGASVRLIESHGQLGGVWTSGLLSWVLDWGNKGGVMAEVRDRLHAIGGARDAGALAYDPEKMKLVLEQACVEAGVSVRLHTRVVAAGRGGDGRLAVAITESKSGREAFAGEAFVDASGDGDLAAMAGCGFDLGRPAEGPGAAGPDRVGETQPMTLLMVVTGIDDDATADCHRREGRPWAAPKDALLAELRRGGHEPTYGRPTIFPIDRGLYAWMINHEYGVSALDAQQITDATLHARAELHHAVEALRGLGGRWSGLRIVATASQIGVREGRRVHGRYTVRLEDMIEGARHEDAVCRVTFGIDVHSTNKAATTGVDHSHGFKTRSQPYDIPYRALVAKDIEGLLLAGRCISGDFLAHSSYRVTGNSVALGQAAGTAAALCAKTDRLPSELPFDALAPLLPPVDAESAVA